MDREMKRQVERTISHRDTCTGLYLYIVWLRRINSMKRGISEERVVKKV